MRYINHLQHTRNQTSVSVLFPLSKPLWGTSKHSKQRPETNGFAFLSPSPSASPSKCLPHPCARAGSPSHPGSWLPSHQCCRLAGAVAFPSPQCEIFTVGTRFWACQGLLQLNLLLVPARTDPRANTVNTAVSYLSPTPVSSHLRAFSGLLVRRVEIMNMGVVKYVNHLQY